MSPPPEHPDDQQPPAPRPQPVVPAVQPLEAVVAAAGSAVAIRPLHPFGVLLLIQFAFGISWALFLILPKHLTVHFHANAQQLGIVMAAGGIANLAASPVVGRVLSALGYARTILIGNACMALAAFAFITVREVDATVFGLRALQGVAWALMFSGGSAAAAAVAPAGRLAQYMAAFSSVNMITTAIGPVLAEWLLETQGAPLVFGTAAASACLGSVLAVLGGNRLPMMPARPAASASGRAMAANRFVVLTVMGLASGVVFTFHQPFAMARGVRHVSAFLLAYTLAALVVRALFGRLPDRFGLRPVSAFSLLLYALVVVGMVWLTPWTLIVFGTLFGIAHGMFYPAFLSLCVQEAPAHQRANALAAVNAAFSLGTMGLWPMGALGRAYGLPMVFIVVGVITWMAAWTLVRAPAQRH